MSRVSDLKQNIAEKYGFYLLLIPLVAMVTIDDSKLVTNIYRVLICLPLLFLARWQDVTSFSRHPFVRRYLLFVLFCALSLLWSETDTIKNMALKILAMTVFLFLIYTVSVYQSAYFRCLDSVYILLGTVLLAFYLVSYLGRSTPVEDVYGVFGNKNELAWFLAAVCLVVAYKLVNEGFNPYLLGILLIVLAVIWEVASRASLMAVYFGLLMVFCTDRRRWLKVGGLGIMIVLPFVLWLCVGSELEALLLRADSNRFYIYQNAFSQITGSATTFLFGHGLAADSENVIARGDVMGHWHSIYISMLFYGGLIGLGLLFYCFFYRFWLLIRNQAEPCVWDVVAFGVAIALLFDGNRVFNYPNSVFISFVLPAFFANFQQPDRDQSAD